MASSITDVLDRKQAIVLRTARITLELTKEPFQMIVKPTPQRDRQKRKRSNRWMNKLVEGEDTRARSVRRPIDELIVEIFPKGFSTFTLYNDSEFSSYDDKKTLEVLISSIPCLYRLKMHSAKPKEVKMGDGREIPEVANGEVFSTVPVGWVYDDQKKVTWVKWYHGGGRVRVLLMKG